MVLLTGGFLFLLFPLAPLGLKLLNSVSHVAYLGVPLEVLVRRLGTQVIAFPVSG